MQRKAFTLVELLVVIGIISVLIAILLPTLANARNQARVVQCMSNQRQVQQSIQMFIAERKGRLPGLGGLPGASTYARGVAQHLSMKDNVPDTSPTIPDSILIRNNFIQTREIFRCPEIDSFKQGLLPFNTAMGGDPVLMGDGCVHFSFNTDFLGNSHGQGPGGSPADSFPPDVAVDTSGHFTRPSGDFPAGVTRILSLSTTRAKPAAEVVLMADAYLFADFMFPFPPTNELPNYPETSYRYLFVAATHKKQTATVVTYMDGHTSLETVHEPILLDPSMRWAVWGTIPSRLPAQ